MVRIADFHGKTVATSKNLRGVLAFARKHPVNVVTVADKGNGNYEVIFYFEGCLPYSAVTNWADWRVLLQWLVSRKSWSVERITILGKAFYDHMNFEPNELCTLRQNGTIVTYR